MKRTTISLLAISTISSFAPCGAVAVRVENKLCKIVYEDFCPESEATDEGEIANSSQVPEEIAEVNLRICFDYSFEGLSKEEVNDENYREIRNRQRELSRQYHSERNAAWAKELGLSGYESLEIDFYAPYVTFSFSKEYFKAHEDGILEIVNSSSLVDAAYVQPGYTLSDNSCDFSEACEAIGASDMMTSKNLTGKEIKVGILDVDGIIDDTDPNIDGTLVTNRKVWYWHENISIHATAIASIIGGKYGIAPNSLLYGVQLVGNPSNEMNWLLENDVDIVNMSFGDSKPDGKYSSLSAYMDYVARTNWVSFVASAGNSKDYVGNPGLGYNVITVGATDGADRKRADYSSYHVVNGPDKPNLVAPSGIVLPNKMDAIYGTSFSAPMVVGALALLQEEFPRLDYFPELALSALAVSSDDMSGYSSTLPSGLNDEVGAGFLDYRRARIAMSNALSFANCGDTHYKDYLRKKTVHLTEGQTLKAAIGWFGNKKSKSSTGDSVTDYDLHLLDSAGNVVKSAASAKNNVELLEYTASTSGDYTLGVFQYGYFVNCNNKIDWGGLSYIVR